MAIRELRRVAAALILVGGASLPAAAMAQGGFFATPSCALTEVYDDNLFLSASQPEEDFISRLSPAIEAGYRSVPLILKGRHIVDAESYARHSDLDTSRARAHTGIDFRHQLTRLLTLSADANYTRTQRPGELNTETGIALERAHAERLSLGLAAAYRFDPATTGTAAYTFTRDELAGGLGTDTHTTVLSLNRRVTPRDAASVAYTFRRFLFDGVDAVTSQVVAVGWTQALSARTTATLVGGPRFSEGSTDPELSASVRHIRKRGELSLGYTRSQSTIIGQAGTVDTQTFGAAAAYSPGPSWEVRAAPSWLSSARGDLQTDVYRMHLDAHYRVAKFLSLLGSYQLSVQRGSLDAPGGEEVARTVVLLGIVLAADVPALQRRESPPSAEMEVSP